MHLIIISSSFYSAARRGGPYFLDEKKVCKDSRGAPSLRCRSGRRLVCVPPAHGAPSTPGADLPLSRRPLFPQCWAGLRCLGTAKRQPLYRNTRNLTIAKVPPHFWGYGLPVAGGQHPPQWLRWLCRVRSATGGSLSEGAGAPQCGVTEGVRSHSTRDAALLRHNAAHRRSCALL